MQGVDFVKTNTLCYTLVFSETVLTTPFLNNFKMPDLKFYDKKRRLSYASQRYSMCRWFSKGF